MRRLIGINKLKYQSVHTIGEYLGFERSSQERHYFLDGSIFAMASESPAHADISVNIVASLGNQLKDTPCRVRTKATKVRSGPILSAGETTRGLFFYPDILVICDEPEYHDAIKDVVLNPKVIVEVFSESTEAFDRGEKFKRLRTCNPTLTDYLLVSQDRPQVEHFTRQKDDSWWYRLTTGRDASVTIASISCALKLVDVYHRVTFPPEENLKIGPPVFTK
jgi:Uma2 family endonuclease